MEGVSPCLKVQRPVQTNICFLNFAKEIDVAHVVEELRKRDIVLIPWYGGAG